MSTISGNSVYNSMQLWSAKQKDFTTSYLSKAASNADDIGSLMLMEANNQATFAGQMALARIAEAAAAAKNTAAKSNTADPFAANNAAKKISQIIDGTASFVTNASSTTDAAKTINQIINGTDKLMSTATSTTDAAKTVSQIIAGTDKIVSSGKADMMSWSKIAYNIDALPMPPDPNKVDVAT